MTTTGTTGPVERVVLREVWHNRDGEHDSTAAVITWDDLAHRLAHLNTGPAPTATPGVMVGRSALRMAVSGLIRRNYLRVESTDPAARRDPSSYPPKGKDRLLVTEAGAEQIDGTCKQVEPASLACAHDAAGELREWLGYTMLPHSPTPGTMGARYERAAELLGSVIANLARAAVAQGDYLDRDAFLENVEAYARDFLGTV